MQKSHSRKAFQKADLIAQEIGRLITQEIEDPRLKMLTITGASMNSDMSIAEILYSHIEGKEKQTEIEQGLKKATGFLRTRLGKQLRLRAVPELRFIWDDFLEKMVYATTDTNS